MAAQMRLKNSRNKKHKRENLEEIVSTLRREKLEKNVEDKNEEIRSGYNMKQQEKYVIKKMKEKNYPPKTENGREGKEKSIEERKVRSEERKESKKE